MNTWLISAILGWDAIEQKKVNDRKVLNRIRMDSMSLRKLSAKLRALIAQGNEIVNNPDSSDEEFTVWRAKCKKAFLQSGSHGEVELESFEKILFYSPIGAGTNETWLFPGIQKTVGLLSSVLEDIEDDMFQDDDAPEIMEIMTRDPRSVFVIHGQNKAAYKALEDFLTSIDLKVVDWSKAISFTGKPSPYVGETVIAGLDNAMAIVALFTDDERVELRENLSKGKVDTGFQPRPNVIFEAGIAFGKHCDRMIFVQVGSLRDMSDIAGIHYIRMSKDHEVRADFIARLQSLGCQVDTSNGKWVGAGNFEASVDHPKP